jgi:tetratricopeptide (TPR) repeat protein
MTKDWKKYMPWIILALIVLSLSTWFVLSKRITQEQISLYEEKIQEASTHVEARQFSTAINKYYEAVDIIPNKVEAYEGIVDVLIMKNREDECIDVVEKSARALSSYDKSILYKKIGDAYYEKDKYRESFDMYDRGLILGVKNMPLELALGKSMIKLGDMDGAKRQFQKQGYEDQDELEANLLLSYIYSTSDTTKAKKTVESKSASGSMEVYYDEFLDVLKSLNEDDKYNASKLSRIYLNNGYPYLAISVLEPMKEDIAEYLEGMYFLGRAYLEYGQHEKALEVLDGALTLGGLESEILWVKARAYFLENDLDNSFKAYDGAIGYMGDNLNTDLVQEYVGILLDNKQILKASELLKTLLLTSPQDPILNILAVEGYYELKESVKVDYYLSQLEKLDLTPTQESKYLEWKIKVSFEKGNSIDEYLIEILEVNKFNPTYYLFLAKTQIQDGDLESAKQSLEKAIEYDLDFNITEEAQKMLSSLR